MTSALHVSVALLTLAMPCVAHAGIATTSWSHAGSDGTVDGVALGDVNGNGRLEVAVVMRNGLYEADAGLVAGTGTLTLLDSAGTVLWQAQPASNIVGFPTFGDFDGDSLQEVAVCETAAVGSCFVYDGDGTQLFSVGPLYYPGNSNGGITAADVTGDGVDDLIIATWGGNVAAYAGPLGTELWAHDLWTIFTTQFGLSWGDYFFGHAAVGDIDADGSPDVVACSHSLGALYAFNGADGVAKWSLDPAANPGVFPVGNYCHGSGPALADIDGVPGAEIIITQSSFGTASSAIAVFNGDGTQRWRTEVAPHGLYFSSPSAADVDGDGVLEIFAQATDGTLIVLDASGAAAGEVSLGGESWVSPGFIDVGNDGNLEILAASTSSLYILDGASLAEIDRFDNPTAGIFPPPVQGDTDGDGKVEILGGAWWPKQLYGFDLVDYDSYEWLAYSGLSGHTGALDRLPAPGDPLADPQVDVPPVVAVEIIDTLVQELLADPTLPPPAAADLEKSVVAKLAKAQDQLQKGSIEKAAKEIKKAVEGLIAAATTYGIDTSELQRLAATVSLSFATEFLDRARSIMGPTHNEILKAEDKLATGVAKLSAGDYLGAVRDAEKGAKDLKKKLVVVGNFCTGDADELYHLWLCQIYSERDLVTALVAQYPADVSLATAEQKMGDALKDLSKMKIDKVEQKLREAIDLLAVSPVATAAIEAQVADYGSTVARLYVDAAVVDKGETHPDIIAAEALYTVAETDRTSGNYGLALEGYRQTALAARP